MEVGHLIGLIEASNEIDRVNKFDNLFHLAPSRMFNDKYFSNYDFLKFFLQ